MYVAFKKITKTSAIIYHEKETNKNICRNYCSRMVTKGTETKIHMVAKFHHFNYAG